MEEAAAEQSSFSIVVDGEIVHSTREYEAWSREHVVLHQLHAARPLWSMEVLKASTPLNACPPVFHATSQKHAMHS